MQPGVCSRHQKRARIIKPFYYKTACQNYVYIDAGTGLSIDIAKARRECYRTAILLMIYQMEQNGHEYQFIYNVERDIEEMRIKFE